MKIPALILVAVVALAGAQPVENVGASADTSVRNSVLEEMLLEIVEEFRQTMLTGSDDLPVLDPLKVEHLHLDLNEAGDLIGVELEDSQLTVGNAEARYLSTFVIDDLSLTITNLLLQRYTLLAEGHIPVIDIEADSYDLNLNALGMNIFGAGKAKMRIIEPRITARIDMSIGILGGLSINLRDADVVFFLRGFEPQITGLFHNDVTNDFINAFLSNLIPEFVEYFKPEISEVINSVILGIGSIDLRSSAVARDIGVLSALPMIEDMEKSEQLPPNDRM